jgi:hypothetical protein
MNIMGLMTMLTGKPRIQRQLESRHEKLFDLSVPIATHLYSNDQISKEDIMPFAISSMIASEINQYVTHYVRTQLTFHPKWTTEANFTEMGQTIVAHLAMLFSMLKSCDFDSAKFIVACMSNPANYKAEDLIMNMHKCCPLITLMDAYPSETYAGLNRLLADLQYFIKLSSIDHDYDYIESLMMQVKVYTVLPSISD